MPLDVDIRENSYNISVRFSKVAELLALIHMLADSKHHSFDSDWKDHIFKNISDKSLRTLVELSESNFPGLELYDFVTKDDLYDSIPDFISKISSYDDIEFLYIIFDGAISINKIADIKRDRNKLCEIRDELPWLLKGFDKHIEHMLYNTSEYRQNYARLLSEVYSAGFEEKLQKLSSSYSEAMESIEHRLQNRNPIVVAEEIKGAKFTGGTSFSSYIFTPSYFFHHHNIISYNQDTFMMVFNINIDNSFDDGEAERLSELLKVMSDKSRLEILRQLKRRSTYGKVLASRLKLTTATISRHLDQLKSINLIREVKHDNVKYFRVNDEEIEKLFSEIKTYLNKK